jgi:hypothetical protein
MAASATLALKAGVWFRRGRLFIVSPDSGRIGEIELIHDLGQTFENLVSGASDCDPAAIFGRVVTMQAHVLRTSAHALPNFSEARIGGRDFVKDTEDRLVKRNINHLPPSRAVPRPQSKKSAQCAKQPGIIIRECCRTWIRWWTIRLARQERQPLCVPKTLTGLMT